jgi:hypothetical protein
LSGEMRQDFRGGSCPAAARCSETSPPISAPTPRPALSTGRPARPG